MKHLFHPEAEAEFLQAVEYYEDCAEGLGHDFRMKSLPPFSALFPSPRLHVSPLLTGNRRGAWPPAFRFPGAGFAGVGKEGDEKAGSQAKARCLQQGRVEPERESEVEKEEDAEGSEQEAEAIPHPEIPATVWTGVLFG